MSNKPMVFISYSWDNKEHREWTGKLCNVLSNNGVEVLMDKYEVFLGSNLEGYMSQGLNNSKYILCICSEGYLKRANDPKTGVGKEVDIIRANNRNDFIIPVIRDNKSKMLPDFLEGKLYLDFNDVMLDDRNESDVVKITELLMHIFNVDDVLKPQKGSNPFDASLGHRVIIHTKIRQSMFNNPELTGTAGFDYSNNNGEYVIGTGDFSFTTQWSKASDSYIHTYNDSMNIMHIAIIKDLVNMPEELPKTEGLDFTSRTRSPKRDDGIVWLNTSGHFAITIIRDIKDDTRGDHKDWVEFDYRVYLAERSIDL